MKNSLAVAAVIALLTSGCSGASDAGQKVPDTAGGLAKAIGAKVIGTSGSAAKLARLQFTDVTVDPATGAVLSQRLVRRICQYCREPYQPSVEELAFLRAIGGEAPDGGFLHGAGCNFCAHTGYLDRTGVSENVTGERFLPKGVASLPE